MERTSAISAILTDEIGILQLRFQFKKCYGLFLVFLLRSGDDILNECYSVITYLDPQAGVKDLLKGGTLITWVDPPAFYHKGKCISASYGINFRLYFY